jgi:hypothetical protein
MVVRTAEGGASRAARNCVQRTATAAKTRTARAKNQPVPPDAARAQSCRPRLPPGNGDIVSPLCVMQDCPRRDALPRRGRLDDRSTRTSRNSLAPWRRCDADYVTEKLGRLQGRICDALHYAVWNGSSLATSWRIESARIMMAASGIPTPDVAPEGSISARQPGLPMPRRSSSADKAR